MTDRLFPPDPDAGYVRHHADIHADLLAAAQRNNLHELEAPVEPIETAESVTKPGCPKCGQPIERVPSHHAYLNDEQWDSVKAGDWFCERCPDPKTRSGFSYFRDEEIPRTALPRVEAESPTDELDRRREESRRYIASLTSTIEKLPTMPTDWMTLFGSHSGEITPTMMVNAAFAKINEIIDRVNYLSERIND